MDKKKSSHATNEQKYSADSSFVLERIFELAKSKLSPTNGELGYKPLKERSLPKSFWICPTTPTTTKDFKKKVFTLENSTLISSNPTIKSEKIDRSATNSPIRVQSKFKYNMPPKSPKKLLSGDRSVGKSLSKKKSRSMYNIIPNSPLKARAKKTKPTIKRKPHASTKTYRSASVGAIGLTKSITAYNKSKNTTNSYNKSSSTTYRSATCMKKNPVMDVRGLSPVSESDSHPSSPAEFLKNDPIFPPQHSEDNILRSASCPVPSEGMYTDLSALMDVDLSMDFLHRNNTCDNAGFDFAHEDMMSLISTIPEVPHNIDILDPLPINNRKLTAHDDLSKPHDVLHPIPRSAKLYLGL